MSISSRTLLVLILFSVACSSLAQLLLKLGMVNDEYARALAAADWPRMAAGALLNPLVLAGLALYFVSTLAWLAVLAKTDLSYAYPFVGLGFILTLVLGRLVMNETITAQRLLGALLIAVGVVLVGATSQSTR